MAIRNVTVHLEQAQPLTDVGVVAADLFAQELRRRSVPAVCLTGGELAECAWMVLSARSIGLRLEERRLSPNEEAEFAATLLHARSLGLRLAERMAA